MCILCFYVQGENFGILDLILVHSVCEAPDWEIQLLLDLS